MKKSKSKLPVAEPINGSRVHEAAETKEWEARERRMRAEDGLRTLRQAEECRKDKALMKDIKALAKEQMKVVSK